MGGRARMKQAKMLDPDSDKDVAAFARKRWAREQKRALRFIEKTLVKLNKMLADASLFL